MDGNIDPEILKDPKVLKLISQLQEQKELQRRKEQQERFKKETKDGTILNPNQPLLQLRCCTENMEQHFPKCPNNPRFLECCKNTKHNKSCSNHPKYQECCKFAGHFGYCPSNKKINPCCKLIGRHTKTCPENPNYNKCCNHYHTHANGCPNNPNYHACCKRSGIHDYRCPKRPGNKYRACCDYGCSGHHERHCYNHPEAYIYAKCCGVVNHALSCDRNDNYNPCCKLGKYTHKLSCNQNWWNNRILRNINSIQVMIMPPKSSVQDETVQPIKKILPLPDWIDVSNRDHQWFINIKYKQEKHPEFIERIQRSLDITKASRTILSEEYVGKVLSFKILKPKQAQEQVPEEDDDY